MIFLRGVVGLSVGLAAFVKALVDEQVVIEDLAPKMRKDKASENQSTGPTPDNKKNVASSKTKSKKEELLKKKDEMEGESAAAAASTYSTKSNKASGGDENVKSSDSTTSKGKKKSASTVGSGDDASSSRSSSDKKKSAAAATKSFENVEFESIPIAKPFQIIQPTPDHKSMRVNAGNLARLSSVKHKISLVSVVGPYHSGKSFLLNAMLGNMRAFSVGPKTSPETMGIWLCRTNITSAVDGSEIWLMDSEGFFGPGIDEAYDAKIFTIATLLGSHLVYNTVKVINQQAVNMLEMLARRAQLFKTKSGQVATDDGAITPDFLMQMNFPSLTWIVEDFTQDPGESSLLDWLRSYLSHEKGSNVKDGDHAVVTSTAGGKQDHYLSRLFNDISVKALFLPALTRVDLNDLSRLEYSQLTAEFREELEQDVKPHIFRRVKSKSFSATREHMTGIELQKAIHFIVNALQTGVFPELPSLWASWTTQVAEHSLYDSERWFRTMVLETKEGNEVTGGTAVSDTTGTDVDVTSIGGGELRHMPPSVGVFNDRIALARDRTLKFYTELLKDFDVAPDLEGLQTKMAAIVKQAVSQYAAKVHRFVRSLVDELKEVYKAKLGQLSLPHEPETLRRTVQEESALQVRNLTTTWTSLSSMTIVSTTPVGDASSGSSRTSSSSSGAVAPSSSSSTTFTRNAPVEPLKELPWTEKNPMTTLAADLELMAVAKHAENEKVVQSIFQNAVQAALTACDSDLTSREQQLYGKAAMKEFRELTRLNAEKLFENHLKGETWFQFHALYKSQLALVKQEVDVKLTRFEDLNQQRLAVHMREVHDKALQYYKTKKQDLKMPMDEEKLASAHGLVQQEAVDLLGKSVEDLKDTIQFTETTANLERKIMAEWTRMTQKNIELWKIHNDEVTQCAYQKNHIARNECGVVCLHMIIPFLHRSVAQQHLMDCFKIKEKTSGSVHMGPGMQQKIFDSWYEKELAYESNSTWNNFVMIFGTLAFGFLFFMWQRGGLMGLFFGRGASCAGAGGAYGSYGPNGMLRGKMQEPGPTIGGMPNHSPGPMMNGGGPSGMINMNGPSAGTPNMPTPASNNIGGGRMSPGSFLFGNSTPGAGYSTPQGTPGGGSYGAPSSQTPSHQGGFSSQSIPGSGDPRTPAGGGGFNSGLRSQSGLRGRF
ncbi:unnamed protein product [Amoebophrya sp. A25]|nr:unnamed protein product [Amoebophrya sp. A25]|eukprot:GSA25T00000156001.1